MKVLILVAIAAMAGFAQHHAAPSLAGTWKMSFETPHGPVNGDMELQQDGSKVTGNCDLGDHGGFGVTGTVDGSKVTFTFKAKGADMVLTLNGSIDHEKMSGSSEPQGGSWTAVRK
jgi:hypothetical protein